jgi:hypothetical protein
LLSVVDSEAEKHAVDLVEGIKAIDNTVTVLPVVAGS